MASYYTVFAKTDPDVGHKGMSCFIVERDWAGVSTSKPLEKMGQHAAEACQVFFENVEVPAKNLLGREATVS